MDVLEGYGVQTSVVKIWCSNPNNENLDFIKISAQMINNLICAKMIKSSTIIKSNPSLCYFLVMDVIVII
jgi:hypothetical protein